MSLPGANDVAIRKIPACHSEESRLNRDDVGIPQRFDAVTILWDCHAPDIIGGSQ